MWLFHCWFAIFKINKSSCKAGRKSLALSSIWFQLSALSSPRLSSSNVFPMYFDFRSVSRIFFFFFRLSTRVDVNTFAHMGPKRPIGTTAWFPCTCMDTTNGMASWTQLRIVWYNYPNVIMCKGFDHLSPEQACSFLFIHARQKEKTHLHLYQNRLNSNDGIIKFKCVSCNMKYISLWLLT